MLKFDIVFELWKIFTPPPLCSIHILYEVVLSLHILQYEQGFTAGELISILDVEILQFSYYL